MLPPHRPSRGNSHISSSNPTARGSGRGRGRGGRFNTYPRQFGTPTGTRPAEEFLLPPDLNIMDGLVLTPIQKVIAPSVKAVEYDSDVKIEGLRSIGSYNWVLRDQPTILVPGSPPVWKLKDKDLPISVSPDTGIQMADQNGFRMPSATLLPLVEAVDRVAEDAGELPFDWASVDFVTDRNGLRKLLRWIDGQEKKDFRIDVELAGKKTILFNRWSPRTREIFSGYTYGFSFEKASTRLAQGCTDSTGHHRILTYDLNGLKIVVRFEVDAHIAPEAATNVDDIADILSKVKISSSKTTNGAFLNVIKAGSLVPQHSIIEMTTRSIHRQISWKEAYPQLFLSQTAHHYLAIHQRGQFSKVIKRSINGPGLQEEEANLQPDFKRLRRALDIIQNIVIEHGQVGRLSLVYSNGEMKIHQRESQASCLPDVYMERFDS